MLYRSLKRSTSPKFRQMMKETQESILAIDIDQYDEPEHMLAIHLQHALTSFTDGDAAKLVLRSHECGCDNGFESWRLL